jgi:hypothetical protein
MKLRFSAVLFCLFVHCAVEAQNYYSYADIIQGDKPESKWMLGAYGFLLPRADFLVFEVAAEAAYQFSEGVHIGGSMSLMHIGRQYTFQGQQLSQTSISWGPRGFIRKRLYKSLHLRLEYEQMNVEYLEPVPNAEFERVWQAGLNTGLELLTKGLLGDYAYFGLYWNWLHEEGRSPWPLPFSSRIGIYF